jgi:hypothetical protein
MSEKIQPIVFIGVFGGSTRSILKTVDAGEQPVNAR